MAETNGHADGRVVRVIGPVVDVEFPPEPAARDQQRADGRRHAGRRDHDDHLRGRPAHRRLVGPGDRPEAHRRTRARRARAQHRLADHRAGRARACSATSTTCSASRSTPTPRRSTPPTGGRSTATPPPFDDLEPKKLMLETGIKVIDLLEPYVQGGKIGMFGGAGVGKTVIIQEMIRRQARAARRRVGVRRRGRAHARGQRPVPGDDRVRRASRTPRWCSARWTSRRACGCGSRCPR